jgi:cell division protein FtsB
MSTTDELGLILQVSRFHELVDKLKATIATLTAERDALRAKVDSLEHDLHLAEQRVKELEAIRDQGYEVHQ